MPPPKTSPRSAARSNGYEVSGQPLALWNLIIRPPRRRYHESKLGPSEFRLWSCHVQRLDTRFMTKRGLELRCSHFVPKENSQTPEARPVVIYLHQNASCRLEALPIVPMFLPYGITVFCFDFAGCGESDGEYISLGWFERDDLAEIVEYLRFTGRVSVIGLWGRSMGAVTALLHADRDHSIAGMVLDSPFCNLRQLATELAQSDYLSVKVPSWLLSGALALGRARIWSLCGFDIDALSPENHVSTSFIPALFLHGRRDDFIPPHHSQTLYAAYTGDKELELVEGDHNTIRAPTVNKKTVTFFCRAFRIDPRNVCENSFAGRAGYNQRGKRGGDERLAPGAIGRRSSQEALVAEACRLIAEVGATPDTWVGEKQRAGMPCRIEGALQLESPTTQAGFIICITPSSETFGSRPPVVFFTYVSTAGLYISRALEEDSEPAGRRWCTPVQSEVGVPLLCVLEIARVGSGTKLRLRLGGADAPQLVATLEEKYTRDIVLCPATRQGEGTFFECGVQPIPAEEPEHWGGADGGDGRDSGQNGAVDAAEEGAARAGGSASPTRTESSSASGSLCNQQ